MTGFSKIAFVAARGDAAGAARDRLAARYGDAKPSEAELIVALGGDGFMLQTLHKYMTRNVPIYGMNQGTVSFLMNEYSEADLNERLAGANVADVHPLRMSAVPEAGAEHKAHAINVVALMPHPRTTAQLGPTLNRRVTDCGIHLALSVVR